MADKFLAVKRLAINKQAAQEFVLKPVPTLPAESVRKFPELAGYNQQLEQWSRDTGNLIRSLLALRLDTSGGGSTSTVDSAALKGDKGDKGDDGEDGVDATPPLYDVIDGGNPASGGDPTITIIGGDPSSP